jgi:transcription termination/antitermination protein NusG
MILIARNTVGREKTVLDSLQIKISSRGEGIKAVFSPAEIKGYLFIEGDSKEKMLDIIKEIHNIRGVLDKEVDPKTLKKYFEIKEEKIDYELGDIVEVVGGPFKREKAKIIRLIEQKREAKIELIDAVVPIPITIKIDLLKKISSEN